jgi:hypothetical protein
MFLRSCIAVSVSTRPPLSSATFRTCRNEWANRTLVATILRMTAPLQNCRSGPPATPANSPEVVIQSIATYCERILNRAGRMIPLAKLWPACVLAAALCEGACVREKQSQTSETPSQASETPSQTSCGYKVVFTTSSGECVGYCTTRLEISEGHAVVTFEASGGPGPGDQPDQRVSVPLSRAEWQEIADLAANAKLSDLPLVMGCPDCDDGGAESLIIVGPSATRSVSFEYGALVGPVQPLLDRLRALRTSALDEACSRQPPAGYDFVAQRCHGIETRKPP